MYCLTEDSSRLSKIAVSELNTRPYDSVVILGGGGFSSYALRMGTEALNQREASLQVDPFHRYLKLLTCSRTSVAYFGIVATKALSMPRWYVLS